MKRSDLIKIISFAFRKAIGVQSKDSIMPVTLIPYNTASLIRFQTFSLHSAASVLMLAWTVRFTRSEHFRRSILYLYRSPAMVLVWDRAPPPSHVSSPRQSWSPPWRHRMKFLAVFLKSNCRWIVTFSTLWPVAASCASDTSQLSNHQESRPWMFNVPFPQLLEGCQRLSTILKSHWHTCACWVLYNERSAETNPASNLRFRSCITFGFCFFMSAGSDHFLGLYCVEWKYRRGSHTVESSTPAIINNNG